MRHLRIDFASTRLAFVLIALLVVHVLAAAIIPQRDVAEDQFLDMAELQGPLAGAIEALHLDRIYTAWPFHALLGLLTINLAVGNIRRFRQVYRLEKTLLRLKHVGSIVFHLALVVILLGAIGNYLFKFQGVFALTEGQSASDDEAGYFRVFLGPLAEGPAGEFRVTMEQIDRQRQQGGSTLVAAEMKLEAPPETPRVDVIEFGHPMRWRGREFHLGARTGFSPEVLVIGPDGIVTFRSFVRIAAANHEGQEVHSDFLMLPGQLTLRLEIHEPERPEPLRWVSVERADSVLFRGYVAAADTVQAGDLRVVVPRMRRWTFGEVRRNPGLGAVFAGFWVALAGLALTFAARMRAESNRGRRTR